MKEHVHSWTEKNYEYPRRSNLLQFNTKKDLGDDYFTATFLVHSMERLNTPNFRSILL
jgi:hypothetical protein